MSGNCSHDESKLSAANRPRTAACWSALLVLTAAVGVYLAGVAALGILRGGSAENHFSLWVFLLHIVFGGLVCLAGLFVATRQWLPDRGAHDRRRRSVWGLVALLIVVVFASGTVLLRDGRDLQIEHSTWRPILYALHVAAPVLILGIALLFRGAFFSAPSRSLPKYAGWTLLGIILLAGLHWQWPSASRTPPPNDEAPFFPSLTRTETGALMPAATLMRDQECQTCHADVHADWQQSAHRASSFNNPVYLAAARETRSVAIEKHGDSRAFNFCAGCHDPVPMLSGTLDDAIENPQQATAQAGITCTVCHAITAVGPGQGVATRGNADYTIAEPARYPLSDTGLAPLDWLNRQLLLVKPAVHKQTFLKPLHKTPEFCGTCHKVHIPEEFNGYKFLRGQNHYDSFVQSGVSGYGARSFYYPEQAAENCGTCHMPPRESRDLGADDSHIRDHQFPAANTALAAIRGDEAAIDFHHDFLLDSLRVDLFGIREQGRIDGPLHAPLRPEVPTLKPGGTYLLEAVIRTLRLGHQFTQGTVDSNEVWLEVTVTDGAGNVIGRSGTLDDDRRVDPWSHFVNAFVIDRHGNRINRRNVQDIFVALYNHQIPPGAAQTVHYAFTLPQEVPGPVTVDARLRYRKFDRELMQIVSRELKRPELAELELPIVDIAQDRVSFPVEGSTANIDNPPVRIPPWQRWNDFGIGLLLNGPAELRQAEEAFREVQKRNAGQGSLNLARVFLNEGRLSEAGEVLEQLKGDDDSSVNWWTVAWLDGVLQHRLGNLVEAARQLKRVIAGDDPELAARGFDFSRDYVVLNQLGEVLFDHARSCRKPSQAEERQRLLRAAVAMFQRTLKLDSENLVAHHNLARIYQELGDESLAEQHRQLHLKYKPDDSARGEAIQAARKKYPAANHAAGDVVIYDLQRNATPNRSAK